MAVPQKDEKGRFVGKSNKSKSKTESLHGKRKEITLKSK